MPPLPPKAIIAVVHVAALPGTPAHCLSLSEIIAQAVTEAQQYQAGGVDAVVLENMHDTPYLRGSVGPEIVAALALVAQAVKAVVRLPLGIQILAGANREALAVAHAAGLDFIRAEGFAFAHVADEGFIQSSAAELLRYRKQLGAERVQVWADIKKKHSAHALTADVSLGVTAETVEFMRGDAVIVTGNLTGEPPRVGDLQEAQAHTRLPVLLGSGLTPTNLGEFWAVTDGFIVGSYCKVDGLWANPVDPARVAQLVQAAQALRANKG